LLILFRVFDFAKRSTWQAFLGKLAGAFPVVISVHSQTATVGYRQSRSAGTDVRRLPGGVIFSAGTLGWAIYRYFLVVDTLASQKLLCAELQERGQ